MRFLLLFPLALAATAADPPPLEPAVTGLFPRGLSRGAETVVTLRGRAAPTAEPGRRDLRLFAPHGSTLTWLDVSTRPESLESEPNNDPQSATPLQFPALVNGRITPADYDYFRFSAAAGQTLTFDLLATRNGSSLDGVLEILDAHGRSLAFSDDYYAFKDPHLVHTFPAAGEYLLRIYGSGESGSETADYRLIAGPMPHASLALPAGATRGATVEFDLIGVNLHAVDEVTLGPGLARGSVLSRSPTRTRVSMRIPPDAPLGPTHLHIAGATLPVPFVIGALPEITARARRRQDPQPVPLGTVVNGVIEEPRAADYYSIRIDKPETLLLSVESMNLGFLLDPLIAVHDESGKRIAWQDEPTTNTGKEPANLDPHLALPLATPGRYTVAIRDSQFRGDPAYLYRLTLKRAAPDFSLRVVGAHATLYRGRTNIVNVRVRRLEGWNTPVEVWAENLPPGVSAPRMTAEPKNTSYTGTCGEIHYLDGTNVAIPFTVAPGAPLDLSRIVFKARGVINGRTVEHQSRARYWKSRIRVTGDAADPAFHATIADLPGVVFQTPERAAPGKLTVILTRLDDAAAPLTIHGHGVQTLEVPAGVTRAEVVLTTPGEIVLNGSVAGRLIGQSHPIRVESRK
jgi:hypothetical protein